MPYVFRSEGRVLISLDNHRLLNIDVREIPGLVESLQNVYTAYCAEKATEADK